jgi:hypothetical protein
MAAASLADVYTVLLLMDILKAYNPTHGARSSIEL